MKDIYPFTSENNGGGGGGWGGKKNLIFCASVHICLIHVEEHFPLILIFISVRANIFEAINNFLDGWSLERILANAYAGHI